MKKVSTKKNIGIQKSSDDATLSQGNRPPSQSSEDFSVSVENPFDKVKEFLEDKDNHALKEFFERQKEEEILDVFKKNKTEAL